ncbi:MAG: metallophosphoesterase [Acidobacteria bacterium]|nr:metallophosphoesterase [Acidobacteriota bacterium]
MGHLFDRFSGKTAALAGMGLLITLLALPLLQPAWGANASSRVVAVGDVHGDLDALVSILQEAGIIDDQRRWSGGNATLVQTGDILDRGVKDRQVMDLLMELEKQASKGGGRLVVLLGNHEMMNIMGDLRYVAPEVYSSFVDEKSEQRRQKAYQDYVKLIKQRARVLGKETSITPEFERQWMGEHPPGFLEYRKALEPKGKYGRWLRERPAIVQIADTIFLHGGIHPSLASLDVKELNQRIKNEIQAFDTYTEYMVQEKLILSFFTMNEIVSAAQAEVERREAAGGRNEDRQLTQFLNFGSWLSTHPDGPLWFRGFAQWSEEEGARQLPQLLKAYEAKRFVVGHTIRSLLKTLGGGTPQLPVQIQMRFQGKIFLIDTGMLSSFYRGGQASALEIQEGKFTAIYLDGRKELGDRPEERTE